MQQPFTIHLCKSGKEIDHAHKQFYRIDAPLRNAVSGEELVPVSIDGKIHVRRQKNHHQANHADEIIVIEIRAFINQFNVCKAQK